MYKIKDFQVGEKIYVLPPDRDLTSDRDSIVLAKYTVGTLTEDRMTAFSAENPEVIVEFIESATYGVIEDNHQIRKSLAFRTEKEGRDYYEKDCIEKWFRLVFAKMPQSDFPYEKIKKAKNILKS